jgi:uncharacterized protein YcaQ
MRSTEPSVDSGTRLAHCAAVPIELSNAEARALAVRAQALTGRRHRDPLRLLGQLHAIQIDTISVIARSHELVTFARLGRLPRGDVTRSFWERGRTFEYWAHAACVLPLHLWPLFAWRRRRNRERFPVTAEQREVLARLRDLGTMTSADLGGARSIPGWWEWSPGKRATEQLLARGDVVCAERRGFRRVYSLPERAIPDQLRGGDPGDAECFSALVARAAACLGVATIDDLGDYFRMPIAPLRAAIEAAGLEPAAVEGWDRPAWLHPDARAASPGRLVHRPVLLSPFDSLIWHRRRTERLFGFRHRLEAYTPAAQRVHGYFVMPLLSGGRLTGRVDPKRDGTVLRARRVSLERAAVPAMAAALKDAARWVGCDDVDVEMVSPAALAPPLRAALSQL